MCAQLTSNPYSYFYTYNNSNGLLQESSINDTLNIITQIKQYIISYMT